MARVERIRVYPVKALDGEDREAVRVTEAGVLAGDRQYALFGPGGEPVNGKRTDRVHDLRTAFDAETHELTVHTGGEAHRFDLDAEPERAEAWLGEFFGVEATLSRDDTAGFPDRPEAGPSVVSTATLEAVASWYEELTVDGVRRRLRANVEVGGVPAFWEDRFLGEGAPAFEVGGVTVEGVTPCGRCVVPERDPDTGEPTPEFRERFLERRRETLPDWADRDAFEHFYAVMLIARVPEADRGGTVAVGDPVVEVDRPGHEH
jgi:uncharacterized protein YcbX